MSRPDLTPGQILADKYRIVRLVGEGAMGVVVAAEHLALRQVVAIKVLHRELSAALVERFVREAKVAATIGGRHVPTIFDADRLPSGAPYVAMELLDGEDLGQMLERRGKLPVGEVADLLLQACEPLARAHAMGIVHRDLKPANLFLARNEAGSLLKVLDFGLAKLGEGLDGAQQAALTGTGSFLGSPAYMAPEQWVSARQADARCDVWALGCVAYELATGRLPFDASSLADLFQRTLESTPPSPRQTEPSLPQAFDSLVMRCLEKEPDQRFQEARSLALALLPLGTADCGRWLDPGRSATGPTPSLGVASIATEMAVRPTVPARTAWTGGSWAFGSAPTDLADPGADRPSHPVDTAAPTMVASEPGAATPVGALGHPAAHLSHPESRPSHTRRQILIGLLAFGSLVVVGLVAALGVVLLGRGALVSDGAGSWEAPDDDGEPLGGMFDAAPTVLPKLMERAGNPDEILWFTVSESIISLGARDPHDKRMIVRATWFHGDLTSYSTAPVGLEPTMKPFRAKELELRAVRRILRDADRHREEPDSRGAQLTACQLVEGALEWHVLIGRGPGNYQAVQLTYDSAGRPLRVE